MDWLAQLQAYARQGVPAVLVTVAAVRGHAPREAGAKMIVTEDATHGTVGGGNLEATAVRRARDLLRGSAPAPEVLTLRLTEHAPAQHGRQCCGGEVTLLLEPLSPHRQAVAIFGVGHVGLALARIMATLDIELHLVDSRAEQLAPQRLAGVAGQARVRVHHAPIPDVVLHQLPRNAHLVVMTHDHAEDIALIDAALRRPDLGFVGLIGSTVKWLRFQARLREEGHAPDALARVTTPIGVSGIRGKSPEVIAIAVAAQLTQVLERQHAAPTEVTHA